MIEKPRLFLTNFLIEMIGQFGLINLELNSTNI
jgi:hypothetical protein